MGISTTALPDGTEQILWSYNIAIDTVSRTIQAASPTLYLVAVYNLAGDTLINLAPDAPPSTYFADIRKEWGVNDFVAGVVTGAGDESTSDTLVVPEAFKTLSLANLQNLKTQYGREYLSIAQRVGTAWGIS
jgi:hypothetical protein